MTSCWHFCKHMLTYCTRCPEFYWNALRNYLWTDSLCKHRVSLSMTAGSPCGANKGLRINKLNWPIASSPNKEKYICFKSPWVPVRSKTTFFFFFGQSSRLVGGLWGVDFSSSRLLFGLRLCRNHSLRQWVKVLQFSHLFLAKWSWNETKT